MAASQWLRLCLSHANRVVSVLGHVPIEESAETVDQSEGELLRDSGE